MRRREFIAGLGSAVAWPLAARAQQSERMRRIGVLIDWAEADPEAKAALSALSRGLSELGWTDGRDVRMDVRFGSGDIDRMRSLAKELVDLQPDAILASSTPATAALQRVTRTIPIVFVTVGDPIGPGFVASLPHPGGNITGFTNFEASMGGKWLELLTEIAPRLKRAVIMFNPDTAPGRGSYFRSAIEEAARTLKVEAIATPVRRDSEIESAMNALRGGPSGGVIATADSFMIAHRAAIILQAARNSIPVVYSAAVSVRDGGLISYGPDQVDNFHRSASYLDRILRGGKPEELPVQQPIKFQIALNAKTARALGFTVSASILTRADEVIE
jgi:putative tryptophan/tyrosine transport system substrate-binding protein